MPVIAAIVGLVWIGSLGWVFWAHNIDKNQPWQLELAIFGLFLVLSAVLIAVQKRINSQQPQRQAESPQPSADRNSGDRPDWKDDISAMSLDEIHAALQVPKGVETRAGALPGWALVMRSPWRAHPPATSWIGGRPRAPQGFEWPLDAVGNRLRFMMQIDLSALGPEPQTGQTAPGLPRAGALLIFIGAQGYAIRVLTPDQVAEAEEIVPPDLALSPDDQIHTGDSLPCWPVDPVAYLDGDGGRPAFLPDPFVVPEGWLDTWGIAALEARDLARRMALDLDRSEAVLSSLRDTALSDLPAFKQDELRYRQHMVGEGADLLDEIEAFAARAESLPGEAPVDADRLRVLFARRQDLAQRIEACASRGGTYAIALALKGQPGELLRKLHAAYPKLRQAEDLDSIPPAYRGFLEKVITDWRGHRLFGLETPPPENTEDLRGQDCLFALSEDAVAQIHMEHSYGLSVWCPRDEMAAGRFDGGQLLYHSNG